MSGNAIGEDLARETRDVLADARAMFNPGDTGLHWEELAGRLADRMPGALRRHHRRRVSAQLRGLRVRSVDVKRAGLVRKGCRVDDVDAVLAARPAR